MERGRKIMLYLIPMAAGSDLTKQHCIPCEGGVDPLTEAEYTPYLAAISGWHVTDGKQLEKEYKWKNFTEALSFVNKVGAIAESEGHHPDISIFGWNKVKITLSTHAIGGLSINDFILAAKIDAL